MSSDREIRLGPRGRETSRTGGDSDNDTVEQVPDATPANASFFTRMWRLVSGSGPPKARTRRRRRGTADSEAESSTSDADRDVQRRVPPLDLGPGNDSDRDDEYHDSLDGSEADDQSGDEAARPGVSSAARRTDGSPGATSLTSAGDDTGPRTEEVPANTAPRGPPSRTSGAEHEPPPGGDAADESPGATPQAQVNRAPVHETRRATPPPSEDTGPRTEEVPANTAPRGPPSRMIGAEHEPPP